jgi:hypothetical protein
MPNEWSGHSAGTTHHMNFFDTPVRRLHFVRAVGMFVLAFAMLAFPLLIKVDSLGLMFMLIFAGLCVLGGVLNIWWGRRTSPTEIRPPINKAPVSIQMQYYRRMLWFFAVTFPIMTAWIAYDLQALQSGIVESVSVWEPFATIYRHFGYWPAVVSSLLLGVVCCLVCLSKLRNLSTSAHGQDH